MTSYRLTAELYQRVNCNCVQERSGSGGNKMAEEGDAQGKEEAESAWERSASVCVP